MPADLECSRHPKSWAFAILNRISNHHKSIASQAFFGIHSLDQAIDIPDQMQREIAAARRKLIQGSYLVRHTLLVQLTGTLMIDVILRPEALAAVP